ncbi:11198_t:CDS:2 [Diversispora eburnea]|uniref:11198_t:CDS:1 n=1 Tax=Diversispora eburnea TaxID=1213867 RepID=A0A9N9BVM0_9GLOM|nr:11198_t:CDS:2 [Diversispora eburnea]
MNQNIIFATILIAFSAFFIYFMNASPIELLPRAPSNIAYCDFTKDVIGQITFTELWNGCVRITTQFNAGFPDRTSKYKYQIFGKERGERKDYRLLFGTMEIATSVRIIN